jgi:hypothetical protein
MNVNGLPLTFMGILPAAIIVAPVASRITAALITRTPDKGGYSFRQVISNPAKSLSLIDDTLGKAN